MSRIVELSEKEVGSSEENVKQKIMVPLLEILGHRRQDLEFEYTTRNGGRIDIFIKNVPTDCKVLIDTKKYSENLGNFVEQIRDYTFSESALISILVNGTDIWVYSPLRGVSFERSMLYSLRRQSLLKDRELQILDNLLSYENLKNRKVIEYISAREDEIKVVMTKEDEIKDEFEKRTEGIDDDLESKAEEIEQLKKERTQLETEKELRIGKLWETLNLPKFPPGQERVVAGGVSSGYGENKIKARKVSLKEAVDKNYLKDNQVLYFFHGKKFQDEQAYIDYKEDKLRYYADNKLYSVSDLAKKIDIKIGLKHDDHGVAGPKYWKTQDGKLLNEINEEIRNSTVK
jgi:hypothetical protein